MWNPSSFNALARQATEQSAGPAAGAENVDHVQPLAGATACRPATGASACGPMEACAERLRHASHLTPHIRTAALKLLDTLATQGRVQVADTFQSRVEVVAGIQWAMEQVLRGPQVILTPERATPFRTVGDEDRPQAQQVRDQGLRARFQRGDPLHLVFCFDGKGTPAQDHAYRRKILDPARQAGEPLFEHVISSSKTEFPAGLSGAFVLSRDEGRPVAFAIRAAQVDQRGTVPCLTLWWGDCGNTGDLDSPGRRRGPSDDETAPRVPASLTDVLAEWSQYMRRHIGRDVESLWNAEVT